MVEVSTFGLEFVAMWIAVERAEALQYKLQMFGVPIDGWIDILCDNMSVKNTFVITMCRRRLLPA
jgi:hypothetical protein